MDTMTYTALRKNLAKTMDQVCDDHEPVTVTRSNARPIVILSLEDYKALEETAYLLRSPKNLQRLLESIAELESGKGIEKELIE
ncbi:type II toxin-antitoxin system prevent-host-death family antitoxin [Acaryochloris sp. IP29b_bin.148]|uniref:type II toxin-antitoxin system Phd/YefM family antitoxin n=1 Tax=Acaryochloris sp. IP29b_bin.148 TaxID=2969218 RepID=UPI003452D3E0